MRDPPVSLSGANRLLVQPFPAPGKADGVGVLGVDLAAIGTLGSDPGSGGYAVAATTVGAGDLPQPRSSGSSCCAGWTRSSTGWSPSTSGMLAT
jgi:hypothetical protein